MVSSTIALIPPILTFSSEIFLISSTAANVLSSLVEFSNRTRINSLLSLATFDVISSGNISTGIFVPAKSLILTTFVTESICLYFSSSSNISLLDIFSTTTMENAPIWKSSVNISSPFNVSISLGK